jgi:SAM-dependent methyltransferase
MTTIYVSDKDTLPKRAENDEYITEITLIEAAFESYGPRQSKAVLDIGAGDGRWGKIWGERTEAKIIAGVEIQDKPRPTLYTHWYDNQDFMTWETDLTFDLIVSNPPYFIAEPIIRKAWSLLRPEGRMVFLLRLAFLAGVGRYNGLWNDLYPNEVAVMSRRPSFYGGGTNGTDFGLFVWDKNRDGSPVGMPQEFFGRMINYEREKK